MSKSNCTKIRCELDELNLDEDCGAEALQHLSECNQCRDFYQKQTRLRQIVGSLGTVAAPPDFDFRLRSRLTAANANSAVHIGTSFWAFAQRSVAVATALVLLVGAVVMVRHLANQKPTTTVVADQSKAVEPAPVPAKTSEPIAAPDEGRNQMASMSGTGIRRQKIHLGTSEFRLKRSTVAKDSAAEQATVVRAPNSLTATDAIFPVDASQQQLKVSLFDGRGNPRTISLPTVTFGSQRVLPNSNTFAPKGVW